MRENTGTLSSSLERPTQCALLVERISIMFRIRLIRWGGLAAILAGILRGIASFTPTAASAELQLFYFAIDVLLLLGAIGVYAFQKQEIGRSEERSVGKECRWREGWDD